MHADACRANSRVWYPMRQRMNQVTIFPFAAALDQATKLICKPFKIILEPLNRILNLRKREVSFSPELGPTLPAGEHRQQLYIPPFRFVPCGLKALCRVLRKWFCLSTYFVVSAAATPFFVNDILKSSDMQFDFALPTINDENHQILILSRHECCYRRRRDRDKSSQGRASRHRAGRSPAGRSRAQVSAGEAGRDPRQRHQHRLASAR